MTKITILGLDGVPWVCLEQWIIKWQLKNFKHITQNGAYGKLKSTIPCNTCPALPSLYTGRNPGNIGIFDFIKPDGSLVTYRDLKSPAFWDFLSYNGFKSCILGPRVSYPVPEVNGVFVTGMLSAGEKKKYLVYPETIWDQVKDFYPSKEDRLNNKKSTENPQKNIRNIYESCKKNLDKQLHILNKLTSEKRYDFKFYWYGGTDTLLHYGIDNEHYIKKLLQDIDEKLEDYINDQNIIIVSDHGFGYAASHNFHLNEWLQKEGYLKMQGNVFKRLTTRIGYNLAEYAISDSLKKKMLNFLSKGENKNKKSTKTDNLVITPLNNVPGVDWSATQAHLTTAKGWGIRIIEKNLDRPYEELRSEIIQKLKQLKDPKGNRVIKDAWRGEEIYWGKYQDQIPDIIFLKEDIFRVRPSLVGKMFTKIKKRYGNYVGNHDSARDGIFIAHGPDIKDSGDYMGEVQLYDIAPTILHMYGIPVPEDMDGRVLKEIFKEESEPGRREAKYQKIGDEEKLISSSIKQLKKQRKL